jgi:WhiB family transcriptional regulator, redox-sensing transcriptional regulator
MWARCGLAMLNCRQRLMVEGQFMRADGRWWRLAAACRYIDPDLFFPISSSAKDNEQVATAKAVCAVCPVRRDCLAFALRTRQMHGVWGGTTAAERYLLLRVELAVKLPAPPSGGLRGARKAQNLSAARQLIVPLGRMRRAE